MDAYPRLQTQMADLNQKVANYQSEKVPLGQKVIGLYGEACGLIAQAREAGLSESNRWGFFEKWL